jgi:hypothetical protein
VPGGLVNGMEFWLTRETTISSDDLRKYDLIGTVYGTGGTNLVQGDTVELDYDTLDTGNLYVKVRGINGDITGPYSTPSGLINFNATQVTDAIGGNTAVNDNTGNSIGGLLGANGLLWLLNQLMSGSNTSNTAATISSLGSLFGITGNIANTVSGSLQGVGNASKAGNKLMLIADAGKTTVSGLSPTASVTSMYTFTFVPTVSGTYKIDCIVDQNGSGARGADADFVSVGFALKQGGTTLASSNSGGDGTWYWNDYVLTDIASLTAGVTYTFIFDYLAVTPSNPTDALSFDLSWNIYTIGIA